MGCFGVVVLALVVVSLVGIGGGSAVEGVWLRFCGCRWYICVTNFFSKKDLLLNE